jgi:tartrate-resistant acid phosphatase type 5
MRKLWWLGVVCSGLHGQQDMGRVVADQPVRVVAFGDFGTGDANQRAVARAIAARHAQQPFDFGITLGDNFYRCGVKSAQDPVWQTRWEDLYTPLGIPFYASLGNHDYGHPWIICPMHQASPEAEVERTKYSQSWRMPARYYTYTAGPARVFVIDTEGWSAAQREWLSAELRRTQGEPGVRWRIVYGHHPMYTSGVHLNERRIGALRRELVPLFRETAVDLYIAGHDHDLEHLRTGGVEYLIAGGGGAKGRKVRHAEPESVFHATEYGFLELTMDEHTLSATFLDTKLEPLEQPGMRITK